MNAWLRRGSIVAGALAGGAFACMVVGELAWRRGTAQAIGQLLPEGRPDTAGVFSLEELEGLPEPVVRYFKFALTPGQPLIRRVRLEHHGEFNLAGVKAKWQPFSSVQFSTVNPPGFVWDARIRMGRFLPVRVRDSYIGGTGGMLGKALALVPVVRQQGSPELASGALHRYLAEAVWFPTALLPSQGVRWEPIDASRARATLRDGATEVSLEFEFGDTGEVVRVFSPGRFRDVNGRAVLTPWAGVHRRYARVNGMRVPMEGEVEWILREGRAPYWRGRLVKVDYEVSPGNRWPAPSSSNPRSTPSASTGRSGIASST